MTEFLKVSRSRPISEAKVTDRWLLKESGITPTTIARRVRTREVAQPVAGSSAAVETRDVDSANQDAVEEVKCSTPLTRNCSLKPIGDA